MAAEADDVLEAIETHTKAVDTSLGTMKKTIADLEKQAKDDRACREELERKLNLVRVAGVGGQAANEDADAPDIFRKAAALWYPGRAEQLRDFDYSTYRKAFRSYLRGGREGMSVDELKAMQVTSDPDGGYLAPIEFARELIRIERANSVVRQAARGFTIGAGSVRFPKSLTKFAVGWVGETQARDPTASGTVGAVEFSPKELYGMPEVTQTLIDDSMFDMEAFVAEEIGLSFAEEEDAQFISGNSVGKPWGFTMYPTATTTDAAGTRPADTIQYIATGQAGAWPVSDDLIYDKLVDVVHALRPRYRRNAQWMMPTEAVAKLRKLKDSQKQPMWQPSTAAGQPDRFMGYPVIEAEQMPAIAADSFSVAFADWRRAYWVIDRLGVRVLRDPFTNKPYIRFYTTKRVDGGVADASAIKLLKFAAS